jgi:hypothetical protein
MDRVGFEPTTACLNIPDYTRDTGAQPSSHRSLLGSMYNIDIKYTLPRTTKEDGHLLRKKNKNKK